MHNVAGLAGFLGIKIEKSGFDKAIGWGSLDTGAAPSPTPTPAPVGIGSQGNGIMAGAGFWSVTR